MAAYECTPSLVLILISLTRTSFFLSLSALRKSKYKTFTIRDVLTTKVLVYFIQPII